MVHATCRPNFEYNLILKDEVRVIGQTSLLVSCGRAKCGLVPVAPTGPPPPWLLREAKVTVLSVGVTAERVRRGCGGRGCSSGCKVAELAHDEGGSAVDVVTVL